MRPLFASLILSFLAVNAMAVPIHKWVDSKGNVHYSNVAPLSGQTTVLEYQGIGNTSSITKRDDGKETKTELDPELKKRIDAEKEVSRQNCIRSKESVQMLESGVRISRINAKGEKETLDDSGRKEELGRAKKAVKDWCEE